MKEFARDITEDTVVHAIFKHGDGDEGQGYVQYTITVYEEDAGYFESKLLDEAESIFYAQKQEVTPIKRLVP